MNWIMEDGSYPRFDFQPVPPLGCFANADKLKTLQFQGTVEQWEQVQRGEAWRSNAPFTQVICADGAVSGSR